MKYFLVEFDRIRNDGVWVEFDDAIPAMAALAVKEAARAPHVEVVLFMADSLDALRRTHGRYFRDAAGLAADVAAALPHAS